MVAVHPRNQDFTQGFHYVAVQRVNLRIARGSIHALIVRTAPADGAQRLLTFGA